MHVFFEDDGAFKAGTVLADNDTSLQVEAAHGKRSKIKASAVEINGEKVKDLALPDPPAEMVIQVGKRWSKVVRKLPE